jgi:hypothetical protein
MSDISKCNDHLCPSKTICLRYKPVCDIFENYIITNREADAYNCDLFWHNGTCKDCGQNVANHKLSCASHRATILMNLKKKDCDLL